MTTSGRAGCYSKVLGDWDNFQCGGPTRATRIHTIPTVPSYAMTASRAEDSPQLAGAERSGILGMENHPRAPQNKLLTSLQIFSYTLKISYTYN